MSESDEAIYHLRCHLNQEDSPDLWGALDRDELRLLLLRLTWRPIATVPKEDQVPVLLLIEGEPGVCRWSAFFEDWSSDRDLLDPDKATHWMPIASAPEAK